MKSTIALVGAEWFHSIFFTTNNFDSRLNHTQNVLTTFSCSTRPVLQIILTRAWITLKFFLPFIPTTCPHTAWNERSVTWLLLKHLYLFGESRIGLSWANTFLQCKNRFLTPLQSRILHNTSSLFPVLHWNIVQCFYRIMEWSSSHQTK